jgi:hypothetical protein
MTFEEVTNGIRIGKITKFSDIPEHRLSANVAHLWVDHGRGTLGEIPLKFIDDGVRFAAMSPMANHVHMRNFITASFAAIDPRHTARYEELALRGIGRTQSVMQEVNEAFLTKSFLMKAISENSSVLFPFLHESPRSKKGEIVNGLIDQEVVDFALSRERVYLNSFDNQQFTDDSIRTCIRSHNSLDYQDLVGLGRYHVLIDMVREGFWPTGRSLRPESLEIGIQNLTPIKNNLLLPAQDHLLHRAYVLQHTIQEVIAQMNTPDRKKMLLDLYSADELTPYLKTTHLGHDRAFKGHLLEEGLGL